MADYEELGQKYEPASVVFTGKKTYRFFENQLVQPNKNEWRLLAKRLPGLSSIKPKKLKKL